MKILPLTFLFSVQYWASPYFFKVPINIGIHKWTLGYNSFLQFWNPISASKYLFWGKFTISLIVRFKKVSAFRSCLSFLSEIRLGLGCLQLRERTRYWCRNQQGALSDQLLSPKRNCQEIAGPEKLSERTVKWEKFLQRRRRMALMMKALILDLHKNMRE